MSAHHARAKRLADARAERLADKYFAEQCDLVVPIETGDESTPRSEAVVVFNFGNVDGDGLLLL